jgi:hypothetical protein
LVLVIDGSASTTSAVSPASSRLLDDYEWDGGLDAFNDMLRGGFGTLEGCWTLTWIKFRAFAKRSGLRRK